MTIARYQLVQITGGSMAGLTVAAPTTTGTELLGVTANSTADSCGEIFTHGECILEVASGVVAGSRVGAVAGSTIGQLQASGCLLCLAIVQTTPTRLARVVFRTSGGSESTLYDTVGFATGGTQQTDAYTASTATKGLTDKRMGYPYFDASEGIMKVRYRTETRILVRLPDGTKGWLTTAISAESSPVSLIEFESCGT